jgi:hypothetical protein
MYCESYYILHLIKVINVRIGQLMVSVQRFVAIVYTLYGSQTESKFTDYMVRSFLITVPNAA